MTNGLINTNNESESECEEDIHEQNEQPSAVGLQSVVANEAANKSNKMNYNNYNNPGGGRSPPPPPVSRPTTLNSTNSSSVNKSGKKTRWLLCYPAGGTASSGSPSPPSETCSNASTPSPTDHGFRIPNSYSNERPTSLPVALLNRGNNSKKNLFYLFFFFFFFFFCGSRTH